MKHLQKSILFILQKVDVKIQKHKKFLLSLSSNQQNNIAKIKNRIDIETRY